MGKWKNGKPSSKTKKVQQKPKKKPTQQPKKKKPLSPYKLKIAESQQRLQAWFNDQEEALDKEAKEAAKALKPLPPRKRKRPKRNKSLAKRNENKGGDVSGPPRYVLHPDGTVTSLTAASSGGTPNSTRSRSEKKDAKAGSPPSLSQSFHDDSDGGKHWGHMSREHGRFGSYPLFDDYGDESEP